MAAPLKDSFGPEIPTVIATMLGDAWPAFPAAAFVRDSLDGFEALELTPRARHVSDAMAIHLPADRGRALEIITASLGPEDEELHGMEGFRYLPHVFFVAGHGLDHFDEAMRAQYELTKRFTAEFSIRAYIQHDPDRTLERLHQWAHDPSEHVRRLVSEGTRPRLPWAPRLREFQADPAPVLELLELLKDDPEEYVRRSVANNLNDIAKDHPQVVIDVARQWWAGGDRNRRRLVRHGLRTLIKAGDPAALAVLGYTADSPVRVGTVTLSSATVPIGGKVRVEADLENPSADTAAALVDLRVHFVKADGSTSPKVFKGAEVELEPGGHAQVRKTISVAQHSTRKHYPGTHRVEILVNGTPHIGGAFELRASPGGHHPSRVDP